MVSTRFGSSRLIHGSAGGIPFQNPEDAVSLSPLRLPAVLVLLGAVGSGASRAGAIPEDAKGAGPERIGGRLHGI